jgi:adenine-specific DNA-methyltransferase
MVYVGSVDAPVTWGEVKAASVEFWRVAGKAGTEEGAPTTTNGIDVLGWDFSFELNEMSKQMAAEAGVEVRFKRIPREVLEKKAVQQGDIQFFELAALSIRYGLEGRALLVELIDFVISPDDVPPDVQKAVTHWTQWVDYWAVDWDYKGDTFHNQWQHYRTKRDPKLVTRASHTYDEPGAYTVVVKVIDLLGNDTTRALTLEVK